MQKCDFLKSILRSKKTVFTLKNVHLPELEFHKLQQELIQVVEMINQLDLH